MGNYCVLCKEQHESDGKNAHTHAPLVNRTRSATLSRKKIKGNEKRTETHTHKHKTISALSIQYTRFEFKLGTLKIHTIIYEKTLNTKIKALLRGER